MESNDKQILKFRKILPAANDSHRNIHIEKSKAKERRTYSCLECNEKFSSFKQLRSHETNHKSSVNDLVCKYCLSLHKSVEDLEAHTRRLHSAGYYQCYECKKEYKAKGFLVQHNSKYHQCDKLLFYCALCSSDWCVFFKSNTELDDHYKTHHLTIPINDHTNECDDLQMYEEFLEDIIPSCVDDNPLELPVGWDELDFVLPEILETCTAERTYEASKVPYECPKCCKMFNKLHELLYHLAEYHNMPVLHCNYCEQIFNRKFALEEHKKNCNERVSSSNANHICHICQKIVQSNLALNYHIKSHYRSLNNAHHSCPYCSKQFHTGRSLYTHLRVVHSQVKSQTCQLCDQKYPTTDHLRKHVNSHHQKEALHKCAFCLKQFNQLCHLKQHELIHTTGKKYSCALCEKRFWKKINVDRHVLKFHENF